MRRPRPSSLSPWLLGALLFAALFWAFDLGVLRAGVPHPLDDNWEDNIIARSLIAGVGFRSQMLYPPLWPLRDPGTLTIPVLIHGPLLPLVMVPPLVLLGPAALDGVAWLAAIFALLALIPLFRLTGRHFGDPVGFAAALLFTLSPLTLEAVHHSLPVVTGALRHSVAGNQNETGLVAGMIGDVFGQHGEAVHVAGNSRCDRG